MIDWTKPVVFANGQPCELQGTYPDLVAPTDEPAKLPRCIRRIGVEGPASIWFVAEDGQSIWPREEGFYVINQVIQ